MGADGGSQRTNKVLKERDVSAFVEPPLRAALEASARAHDRSMSGEISVALRAYLCEQPGPAEHPPPPGREPREQVAT
jgi:hypothetical protein